MTSSGFLERVLTTPQSVKLVSTTTRGTLSLASDPPGAEVVLYRCEETGGVVTPEVERPLGKTPVVSLSLAAGSYVCVVTKPGYRIFRYPVWVSADAWDGLVTLRHDDEIGDGFAYVPAGPFVYGATVATAVYEIPARKVTLNDFAMARCPVTFGEYAEFLDSVSIDEALGRLPYFEEDVPLIVSRPNGHEPSIPMPDEVSVRLSERYGSDYLKRLPVCGIRQEDATAFCAWKGCRLPTEEEWEKVMRGVDGRRFPWGNRKDRTRRYQDPERLWDFFVFQSVYGVSRMFGMWEWTGEKVDSCSVARGGQFRNQPVWLRWALADPVTSRRVIHRHGFRCAKNLSSPAVGPVL